MGRSIQARLNDALLVATVCSGGDWPRSMFATQAIPDAWMGLILRRDGARRYVPAGDVPKLDDDDRLLLVRNRAFTIPLAISDAPTDGEDTVNGKAEVLVRWQAQEDELTSLHRTMLHDGDLTLEALTRAVVDSGGARIATNKFLKSKAAAALVHDDQRAALAEALREQMKKFLFESGLTIERVALLELRSPTLARSEAQQRDAAQRVQQIKTREMVENATLAATQRRLEGLSGIFEKLKAAASDGQQTRWHELLPALSPQERGQLLANLWRVTPDHTVAEAIVAVAGTQCLWLDPAQPDRVKHRVTLDESLGGLRSIAFDARREWLLVGAGRGVWVLLAEDGSVLHKFTAASATPPRNGFNAVVMDAEHVFATHSQLGFWMWPVSKPDAGRAVLAPVNGVPKAIRAAVLADDGRVLFAADDCVQAFDPASGNLTVLTAMGTEIAALSVLENQLFAGLTDGKLLKLDLRYPDDIFVPYRTSGPLESIEVRKWNDLVELVIPAGVGGIVGVYGDEGTSARLMAGNTAIKRAWACDDVIVGLSDRRDRLVVLNANLPDTAPREAPVSRIVGNSIQDVCLVTRREGGAV